MPVRLTWDNTHFYTDSRDPRIEKTVDHLKAEISELRIACRPYSEQLYGAATLPKDNYDDLIDAIKVVHQRRVKVIEALRNVSTFIYSQLSVDALDSAANTWQGALQQLGAALDQAMKPLQVFLVRASDAFIETLVVDQVMAEMAFSLRCDRRLQSQLLTVPEEQLIAGLGVTGLHAWGNLYSKLAGTLQCQINDKMMGLAQATNLLSAPDSVTRKVAWQGIQSAWGEHQETVAAILNAINGWRLEETQQRAHTAELHYLDKSCLQSRIERDTLTALMETTYHYRGIGQRAIQAMATASGLEKMGPWDILAPAPAEVEPQTFSFDEAITLVAEAFSEFNPEMGEFAIMTAEKGWIDGEPTTNRSTGAYCTKFISPREPRIFMTFTGTMNNITTLAHELGHAWHNWVMRDMPLMTTAYPMTLAETASIFAETLVSNALLKRADTPAQKLVVRWQDAESAAAFLVNIPARFEFEQRLVEARKHGTVSAAQLRQMMGESWQKWYEDSLSEYDELFWATKLHFSISSLGFYNYPYLFGYLFSLGIYAQRDAYAEQFDALYRSILRSTGSMTAEEVVMHHLQQDIRQPQFWQASLEIVEQAVVEFEELVS
ncbi:MAG: M3 family oligoendopeptidase [Cyanobacteria bacterium P01_H01_bin.15]